jgi:hypothetical protein
MEERVTARLWDLGRDLQARVKNFFETPLDPDAAPLELLQKTLEILERKVQPSGRGTRVFPYNRITVRVAQPSADRDAVTAVFRQLEPRLRERLTEVRCEPPSVIHTEVLIEAPEAGTEPVLSVECVQNEALAPLLPTRAPSTLVIVVAKGECEQGEYRFADSMIAIGRTAEPVDAHGNIRRNHVAFLDVRDGVSETVARAHARIQQDAETGAYHLFAEASSNPTFLLRGGRNLRVPPRDPRGLRLQSGDAVQLGRAVLKVTFE